MTLLKLTVKKTVKPLLCGVSIAALLATSGCATSELLDDRSYSSTKQRTVKQVLIEDQLVAFGRPAQSLPNMPSNSVVIVGEKQSYVLGEGGAQMVNILTNLDPKSIRVDSDMTFYSPNNDGRFQGTMKMSYAKLKDEFARSDYQYFLQNGGTECSKDSDMRINAQRFCFTVPIKGAVYPQVSNLSLIQSQYKSLTKPYPVTIYTKTTTEEIQRHRANNNAAEKIVLLPFALAFDVVTFPLQLAGAIID